MLVLPVMPFQSARRVPLAVFFESLAQGCDEPTGIWDELLSPEVRLHNPETPNSSDQHASRSSVLWISIKLLPKSMTERIVGTSGCQFVTPLIKFKIL